MSTDVDTLSGTLTIYRVPDYSLEPDGRGGVTAKELPGLLRIGVEIDGVFVPITEVKAGILSNSAATAQRAQRDADAQLAEQQRQDAEQAAQAQTATSSPSGEPADQPPQ